MFFPIALSTLIPLTHMLRNFFLPYMTVLANVFHIQKHLVGWNDTSCNRHKQTANFWHKIWEDAGHPSSGVLFQIKRHTKTRYKNEVRHLKRWQNVLLQDKFASLFANKKSHQLNHTHSSGLPSFVDGVSRDKMIASLFASKFADVLNNHSSSTQESIYSSIQSSVKTCHLSDVLFSAVEVLEALSMLKSKKSDGD